MHIGLLKRTTCHAKMKDIHDEKLFNTKLFETTFNLVVDRYPRLGSIECESCVENGRDPRKIKT